MNEEDWRSSSSFGGKYAWEQAMELDYNKVCLDIFFVRAHLPFLMNKKESDFRIVNEM